MGKIIRNGITYGGGSDELIQCTQAQYDAWEQAGTIDPTKLYCITDASSGSSLIDDSTTSQSKTWSSDKIDDELDLKANTSTTYTKSEVDAELSLRNNGQIHQMLSNTDANTLYLSSHCGTYWVNNTCTNIPVSWGILEVLGCSVPMQRYTVNSTTSGAGTTVYMRERLNGTWGAWQVIGSSLTACTITKHSDLPSSAPTILIGRRGPVCIIHFAHFFKAGTYYNLYTVTPAPAFEEHAVIHVGGIGSTVVIVTTSGLVRFNNSITLSSDAYLIGQLVYLC